MTLPSTATPLRSAATTSCRRARRRAAGALPPNLPAPSAAHPTFRPTLPAPSLATGSNKGSPFDAPADGAALSALRPTAPPPRTEAHLPPDLMSAPPPPQLQSALVRKAFAADPGLLETETISTSRLRKLKQRGRRLPWLLCALLLSILAAGIGLGMEERERLHTELAAAKQAISDSEAALARLVTAQKEREQAFTVERTQLVATIAEKESALAARAQVSPAGEALVERLRPLLPEKEAEFRATPEGLTIRFDDRVFFPSSSSSELSLDGLRSLVRVATVLRELSPGHHFAVASHVTERQVRPQESAWILTTTRAASITAQLAKELQIEPSRLSAAAFVHPERNNKRERPRDDNNQSRSIELRIVEITR